MGNLSVSMKDRLGKVGMTHVAVPDTKATLANAKKLADWLKTHTTAAVVGYGATLGVTDDTVSDGKYDRCEQRIVMIFKDKKVDSIRRFSYPAPKDADLDDDQQPVSDLPEDAKDTLKTIGALTNDDKYIEYNGGGLDSKLPRTSARKKKMTGV